MNNSKKFESLDSEEALIFIAIQIDEATDSRNHNLAREALTLCDELQSRLNGTQLVELYYFKANAWSAIRSFKHQDSSQVWEWEQTEFLNEIFWLRSAIKHSAFNSVTPFRMCQILVNTGNILSHLGRPIEAFEYWQRALKIMPNFAMAKINLAYGLEYYANLLYDKGHACVLLNHAYMNYISINSKDLVWDSDNHEALSSSFVERAQSICAHVDIEASANISLDGYKLGRSKSEKEYRTWALNNSLFINPLNDIGAYSIASTDVMHLPSMTTDIFKMPYHYGFYNGLKQEFVSARYLLWQAMTEIELYKKHFSDKDVYLINTLDSSRYGIFIEQLKLSFRAIYSLLDKVAYFINDYWELGVAERQVNFLTIWYKNQKKNDGLDPKLIKLQNVCLRGLYWLSKDFTDKGDGLVLGQVMEPDATQLSGLRNHLEHKYVKVYDDFFMTNCLNDSTAFDDELAYRISTEELIAKSLKLMKLVRASLIYLSLAVHTEEKAKAIKHNELKMPIMMKEI